VSPAPYTFRVRGARGTIPCSGSEFLRYGGNTTCFSLDTPEGILIVDAGTGMASVTAETYRRRVCPPVTILFTHFHMDHVIGLPVFNPIYQHGAEVTLMADPRRDGDWKSALRNFISRPYWPVGLGDGNGAMRLVDIPVAKGRLAVMGVEVAWFAVPHPQQCLAYRLSFGDSSVVIATDTEYVKGAVDPAFAAFCRDADALVFDAQFTPEEYPSHAGWGHSTWDVAAEAASLARVKKLVLTHHAPRRTDAALDSIVRETRRLFPETDVAFEGMVLGGMPGRRPRGARNARKKTNGRPS
jgi:phosphoribosyl 1,2-cyclic phosphodiesterase